ncbi:MAG: hypothetical protein GY939_00550 [Actinomycetia bacterium]|nr:hypothetical protein [Actinomycetes bacterium]
MRYGRETQDVTVRERDRQPAVWVRPEHEYDAVGWVELTGDIGDSDGQGPVAGRFLIAVIESREGSTDRPLGLNDPGRASRAVDQDFELVESIVGRQVVIGHGQDVLAGPLHRVQRVAGQAVGGRHIDADEEHGCSRDWRQPQVPATTGQSIDPRVGAGRWRIASHLLDRSQ